MGKKVLIGCSLVAGIFIVVIIVSGYFAFQHLTEIRHKRHEIPAELENPAVLTGSDFVTKDVFYEDGSLSDITDITIGELDSDPGVEIGIAGTRGAVLLDKDRGAKTRVPFGAWPSHIDIVDADNDGICEFMNRGSWSNEASLIDHSGNVLWTYGGGISGVDDMDAGDIDGDGRLEYVVGFNGAGGVHLLDERGEKQWSKRDGNVWHVEFVDTDGDGALEIVHSNAGGQITVRNEHGEVEGRSSPATYFASFYLCRWPTKNDKEYLLCAGDEAVYLFDFDGGTAARLDAPGSGFLGEARGTTVKLKDDEPEFLSIIVNHNNWKRSILYIYDSGKNLVYREILGAACPSIATIPVEDGVRESLLVGGNGVVWQYRAPSAEDRG